MTYRVQFGNSMDTPENSLINTPDRLNPLVDTSTASLADSSINFRAEEYLAGGGEMGALMRALDWTQTTVGPVSTWPQSLQTAVSICIGSRHPIEIWWGPQYVRFYNDAYRPILGADKHPQFLGRPGRECWGEIWDQIGPMLDSVRATGIATWAEDYPLMVTRNGYVEETYFTFSYGPLRDETGGVGGIFCACTETTARVQGERRLRLLRELTARTSEARDVEEVCVLSAETLMTNAKDIAFVSIYQIPEDRQEARLVASSGLAENSVARPTSVSLSRPDDSGWSFENVAQSGQAELVTDLFTRFGELPDGHWPEPAQSAYVLPILIRGRALPTGIIVIGVSPRVALDDLYKDFCTQVAEQLSRAIADAIALEAERKRVEEASEQERRERARLNDIFIQAPTFIAVTQGRQHTFELANPPYYQLIGHREIIGKQVRDVFPDLAGQGFFEILDDVYRTGQPYIGKDVRVVLQGRPNGPIEEHFIDFVYQPMRGPDQSITGVLTHGIDLTERKRAEQERERLFILEHEAREELQTQQERQAIVVRYLRAANRTSSQLIKASSQSEMMDSTLSLLSNDFRAEVCGIWLATGDGRRLTLVGERGLSQAPTRSLEQQIEINLQAYKIGWVARFKRPFVSNDIQSDIHFDLPWLQEKRITGTAVLPLTYHDKLLGVLASFFVEELPLEASAVLSTLASVLSASLTNLPQEEPSPDE